MNNNFLRSLTTALALLFFASCEKEPGGSALPPDPFPPTRNMMTLNEGLFNMNNSTLSLYNMESGELLSNDLFRLQNNRGLGDTGNDMAKYGSKIYIVVNVSSQIEVIDTQGKSIKQIPMFTADNKPRQPRAITFSGNKAYVCSFDGTVSRIDTTSLEVEATTLAGRNPDGICVAGNKLYVSNSGGLDRPKYDSTVSVIDLSTFQEIKKIGVRPNPYVIAADGYGDVYVVSRSLMGREQYSLQRIDTNTDEVAQVFEGLETLNFTIFGDKAYCYNYNFTDLSSSFAVLNIKTEQIETQQFISADAGLHTPYGITVDPVTEDIYITDAFGFIVNGEVYCFDKTGKKKFTIGVGLNPQKIVFTK